MPNMESEVIAVHNAAPLNTNNTGTFGTNEWFTGSELTDVDFQFKSQTDPVGRLKGDTINVEGFQSMFRDSPVHSTFLNPEHILKIESTGTLCVFPSKKAGEQNIITVKQMPILDGQKRTIKSKSERVAPTGNSETRRRNTAINTDELLRMQKKDDKPKQSIQDEALKKLNTLEIENAVNNNLNRIKQLQQQPEPEVLDHLNLAEDKEVRKILRLGEKIYWSGEIIKINQHKNSQIKRFAITDQRLLNFGN